MSVVEDPIQKMLVQQQTKGHPQPLNSHRSQKNEERSLKRKQLAFNQVPKSPEQIDKNSNIISNAQRKQTMLQLRPMSSHKNQNGLNTKIKSITSAAKSMSPNQKEEMKSGKTQTNGIRQTQGGENIQIRIKQMGKHIMFREDRSKLISAGGVGIISKKNGIKQKPAMKNSQHPYIQQQEAKNEPKGDLTPSVTKYIKTKPDCNFFTKQNFWPQVNQQLVEGNASPIIGNEQVRPTLTAHGQRPKTNFKQRMSNASKGVSNERKNSLIKFNIEGQQNEIHQQHQRGLSQQPKDIINDSSIIYPQFQKDYRQTMYGMGFINKDKPQFNPYQETEKQFKHKKIDSSQLPQLRKPGNEFFQQPLSNAYAQFPQGCEMIRETQRSTATKQFRQNPQQKPETSNNSMVYKSMENAIPLKFGVGEYFPTPRANKKEPQKNESQNTSIDDGINVKISREQNVIKHLQKDHVANMNLLFYDFNNSDERAKTGSNFYQNEATRDRLPTRDSKSRGRDVMKNESCDVQKVKQESIVSTQRKKISQQQRRHDMRLGSPNPGISLGLSLSLKKKRAMILKQKQESGPVIQHLYNYQSTKHGRISPATFKTSTSATSGISHNGSTGIEETQFSVNSVFDKKDSIQESIQESDEEMTPRQHWQNNIIHIKEDIQESDEDMQ